MIDTPVETINATKKKVAQMLGELYPDFIDFEDGSYTISSGSTIVMIVVRAFTEKESVIECISNVVTGAEINSELMKFLLRKNAEIHFGAFGLLFDDTIVFQHSLAGSNLDQNELETAINAVLAIADHYDDEIIKIAGGKRAKDLAFDEVNE
ncbi:MAG: T3SS (YopN, CesT) and YbjN peptide-binding chaperone 1 [Chloroflexota bacterium]